MTGFSPRNLKYMRSFAQAWPDDEFVQAVLAQLPWYHQLALLDKLSTPETRRWYAAQAIQHNWSRNVLVMQIETRLLERSGSAVTNFEASLPKPQSDLARESLKDPYRFDFLGLTDEAQEREVEHALVKHVTEFLLELGAGFSFVARQKRIQIDHDDFYIDLLFYNRRLKRLVAIDLKLGDFKAEYKGQMELYLRWLAKHEQEPGEAPPLGIILCSGKRREQIELLELDASGIHVAEYLTVLPPREVLQAKLHEAIALSRARLENRGGEGA